MIEELGDCESSGYPRRKGHIVFLRLLRFQLYSSIASAALGLSLTLLAAISFATPSQAANQASKVDQSRLDPITLQLRWHHQFQFAGYYAAKQQGFYRDAGFEVTIVAGEPVKKPIDEVLAGRAQFGASHSDVLLHRLKGKPLVALAAIFQHSPLALVARQDSDIRTLHDLRGRKITLSSLAEITAMLRAEGIDPNEVDIRESSYDIDELVKRETNAVDAYLTNELYLLKKLGIPYITIKPSTYGIDFYSDILFTTEKQTRDHPERVRRFREASLRGWQYAMQHPVEIISLIKTKYKSEKTVEHLRFEADAMRLLVAPSGIEIGHMNSGRWKHMADTFLNEGMIEPGYSLQGFVYDPKASNNTIVFLGDKGYIPYEYYEDGKPAGANVEFLTALGAVLGRPVEVRLYQWADAQSRFNNGEGHALTFAGINKTRNEIYDFTQRTFTFEYALFAKNQYIDQINVDDLTDKRIAVKRGGIPQSVIENSHPEAKLVIVENIEEAFRLLVSDGADAVVGERLVGQHTLRKSGIVGIGSLATPIAIKTGHIPVIKGNPALLGELNEAISKLKSAGEIKKISQKWLGGPLIYITQSEKNAAVFGAAVMLVLSVALATFLFFISVNRKRERKRHEEHIRRSQRMDAVGQLTGGLAHDFNNILGIVQGNFEILQIMLKGNDKANARIERGLKTVARGAVLTRKLLDFSRKEVFSIERISINGFIRDMEDLITTSLTVSVRVELDLDEDTWLVDIDSGDLQDVIINLALNARDAMPDGGSLVIKSRNKVLDEKYAKRVQGSKAGDFVMLSVSDTGHGMTAEVKEHVLEPFFTTKEQGKGTGLGLSMVYGFIQRAGGHLEIYSETGKGTVIYLYLPRAEKKLVSNQVAELVQTDNLPTGAGTILVVDDEEDLREVAVLYLNTMGYQTLTAENGDKALEILSGGHDIDLLFSDIVMPGGMDGYQLAMMVHEQYPELKILLTSGFTKKRSKLCSAEDKYLFNLNDRILDKPYNLSELAIALKKSLNDSY